jgi:hypothetical protein
MASVSGPVTDNSSSIYSIDSYHRMIRRVHCLLSVLCKRRCCIVSSDVLAVAVLGP